MRARHFLVILLTLAVTACEPRERERTVCEQDIWARLADGPIPEYANFYDEEFTKYPDYAIVQYSINERYDSKNDLNHLRYSLSECRAAFGAAYKAKHLRHQSGSEFLPFTPRFVVFAIQNNAEHKGASTFTASYKVAYVIPIELVFAEHYSFDKAVQAAYVDRAPFYFVPLSPDEERGRWSPREHYKWLAIERHVALLKGKSVKADPTEQ